MALKILQIRIVRVHDEAVVVDVDVLHGLDVQDGVVGLRGLVVGALAVGTDSIELAACIVVVNVVIVLWLPADHFGDLSQAAVVSQVGAACGVDVGQILPQFQALPRILLRRSAPLRLTHHHVVLHQIRIV